MADIERAYLTMDGVPVPEVFVDNGDGTYSRRMALAGAAQLADLETLLDDLRTLLAGGLPAALGDRGGVLAEIGRRTTTATLTIANGAAVSNALDLGEFAGALVRINAAWTTANLGIDVSESLDGTYTALQYGGTSHVQVDTPAAGVWYALPAEEVFAARFIKLRSQDAAGADVNQGAARTITVLLKS